MNHDQSVLSLSDEDRAILTRLEEDMWREATRFDMAFQEQRFAPDFFEFGRSGRVYTRAQTISVGSQPIRAKLPCARRYVTERNARGFGAGSKHE